MTNTIIIRFEKSVIEQTTNDAKISRVIGFIKPLHLLNIVKITGLEANPRYAKESKVTIAINNTLKEDPEMYIFKSKGVLIGASHCKELQRARYELDFKSLDIEGILDGGHNVLAIVQYLLSFLDIDEQKSKFKKWIDLKDILSVHYEELVNFLEEDEKLPETERKIKFYIPIEILKPINEDPQVIEIFTDHLIDICSARNNNTQLKEETKDNKEGIYNYLKGVIPEEVGKDIIWKTNDEGRVESKDLIALSWIVLQKLQKPAGFDIAMNKIYASKGDCVKKFGDFIRLEENSKVDHSTDQVVLTNSNVKSALNLMKDIPALYDYLYIKFPEAYNDNNGSFGKITCVRHQTIKAKFYRSKFYEEKTKYNYPEGFIIPLICGASSLIEFKNGEYQWITDPIKFFERNLTKLMSSYKGMLSSANNDPQKVGKNIASYNIISELISAYCAVEMIK